MKKREKTTSSLVVSTLLIGALFTIAVIYQHSSEQPEIEPNLTTGLVEPEIQEVDTWESIVKPEPDLIVEEYVEPIEQKIEIRFTDAFQEARDSLGPGHTFEWNGNLYTTNRADDSLDIQLESTTYALDTTHQETTSAVDIEIAP